MKSLLSVLCGVVFTAGYVSAQSVTLESKAPSSFSEEKPAYLYFTKAVVTRESKMSYSVDVTVAGDIDPEKKDRIVYYMGFDIDNSQSTGSTSVVTPDFGQDIGVWIVKENGETPFKDSSGSVYFRGKNHDFKITNVKVRNTQISFNLRSELFSYNDEFKFFFSSQIKIYDRRGELVSDLQVDTLKSKGAVSFPQEEKK